MPRATYKYGIWFDNPPTELENELASFRINPSPEHGGLGKAEHFWNIVAILWPEKIGNKNNPSGFTRNPWSEKMVSEACRRRSLAVLGGLNSSKSQTFAAWAIVNWLADPWATMVLLTSTTLGDSKRRMWSSVKNLFQANPGLPGKLIDSKLTIKTDDGSGRSDDKCGITLVAGEKDKEKESVGRLIGIKQKNLLFIADELPELTPALVEAYFSNLAPSNDNAQMIGIGNFNSVYDSLGTFCTPKSGWGSVSPDDAEWDCERGVFCIRFDGLKSPNILLGEDKYPFLYSAKSLARHREAYGQNSAFFWRMCRSFPCPEGDEHVLYSLTDLNAGGADSLIPSGNLAWLGPRTALSSLDPSWTNGGDRAVQWFGWWGVLTNGTWCLCLDGYKLLQEDVTNKKPRDYQIAWQFRDNCKKRNIHPQNAAFDGTAATSFAAIVSEEWSPQVLKVEFGGSPSSRAVSVNDKRTAKDMFDRRVSELWGVGKEFVRAGQIKGVIPELSREMQARHYETSKRGGNVVTVVETKADMKKRIGFSPDLADSFFVMLELVRHRHGALAGGVATGQRAASTNFFKIAKEKDRVYSELYAEADC